MHRCTCTYEYMCRAGWVQLLGRKRFLELGSDYSHPLRGICSSFTLKMRGR